MFFLYLINVLPFFSGFRLYKKMLPTNHCQDDIGLLETTSDFASVSPNSHLLLLPYQTLGVIAILCVLVNQTPISA